MGCVGREGVMGWASASGNRDGIVGVGEMVRV